MAFIFLLIPVIGFAVETTINDELTFLWEQDEIDSIAGWILYESKNSGYGYTQIAVIPYGGIPTLTYSVNLVLSVLGEAGSTVNRYYILTAKGKGVDGNIGLESDPSNEVYYTFIIPPTSTLFFLTIKVTPKYSK
jgi:hypothetical protein